MPYSKEARYDHHRQEPPSRNKRGEGHYETVPLSHTDYARNGGKKYDVPGAKAVVWVPSEEGKKRGLKEKIQSILTPREGRGEKSERRVYRP
jgi:hypothetical protein